MTTISNLRIAIGELLDRQAEHFPDSYALVQVERKARYTYAQLRAECDRLARGLIELGISKGGHVCVWATNYPEWVVAQFATAKIGAVLVTVNPAYRSYELEYVLGQSDASVLFLIGNFRTSDYVAMLNEVIPELRIADPGQLHSDKLPHLRNVVFIPPYPKESQSATYETPPGMWRWNEVLELGQTTSHQALAERQPQCDPDDVINIQYTSGTTGNPKGVMLTHLNIVANASYLEPIRKLLTPEM